MILQKPLVCLDLETTGLWIEKDRIIDMALIRLEPDNTKKAFRTLINPQMTIPAEIVNLTGITNEAVKEAPLFSDKAKEVVDFIGDADLAGFNVERFDLPIIERQLYESGIKFEWKERAIYDTQRIYHLHERRDLKAAYKLYCDKELQNAHTALADTEATLEILQAQVHRYGKGSQELQTLKPFQYETSRDFFDKERKFRWWNGDLYPVFGKYARRLSIRELANKDRAYLEWIAKGDFTDTVKQMAKNALEGIYP